MMPDRADFTGTRDAGQIRWQPAEVTSPHLGRPVPVIAARDIPTSATPTGSRTSASTCRGYREPPGSLAPRHVPPRGRLPVAAPPEPRAHPRRRLARSAAHRRLDRARRRPRFLRRRAPRGGQPVTAIASLNYTVSQINYPAPPVMANPPVPYDAIKDNHTDLAREAVHPQHVSDVLHGLALLGSLGLASGSYILSGHSCGACLAFQSVLQPPRHYGLGYLRGPCTRPASTAVLRRARTADGLHDLTALARSRQSAPAVCWTRAPKTSSYRCPDR